MSFDLRAERMNRGVTRVDLARITQVHRNTLERIENGATPNASTAYKIALWVGRPAAELWPVAEPEAAA